MITNQYTIIVPCYNEARRISMSAFIDYLEDHPHAAFYFVDDGSTDHTLKLLVDVQMKYPARVEVLALPHNVGKAEAVRQGLCHVLRTEVPMVGFLDADLAAPLSSIPLLVKTLIDHDNDLVMGSRVLMLGYQIKRQRLRHYIGRVFATAAAMTLQLPVYDTQCGAKVLRTTSTLKEIVQQPFMSKWLFDIELIARLKRALPDRFNAPHQNVIRECPLPVWEDKTGSKLKMGDGVAAIMDLIKIAQKYK